jgi:hypothetical protein
LYTFAVSDAGRLVFHGPKEQVLPFFEGLGFALPARKGTADFLQEITSKKDQKVCQAATCLTSQFMSPLPALPCITASAAVNSQAACMQGRESA